MFPVKELSNGSLNSNCCQVLGSHGSGPRFLNYSPLFRVLFAFVIGQVYGFITLLRRLMHSRGNCNQVGPVRSLHVHLLLLVLHPLRRTLLRRMAWTSSDHVDSAHSIVGLLLLLSVICKRRNLSLRLDSVSLG